MKNFWKNYWSVQLTYSKWILIIFGLFAYMSAWFDLGWNDFDIDKFGDDLLRRYLPKCLYERLGVEEGEEA